eukprot:2201362-Pleurochrysis_carterae.AAC.2
MPVVYIALASQYISQRVPQPSQQTLKHLAVAVTKKGKVGRMDGGGWGQISRQFCGDVHKAQSHCHRSCYSASL